MIEVSGNLWEVDCSAVAITTNGTVNKRGLAVMGRGVAAQAAARWPWLRARLGEAIKANGNIVYLLQIGKDRNIMTNEPGLISFPVKHEWYQVADLQLIRQSAEQLAELSQKMGYERVVLPRPGCGNGKLQWEDVKPVIESILDDSFAVVFNGRDR